MVFPIQQQPLQNQQGAVMGPPRPPSQPQQQNQQGVHHFPKYPHLPKFWMSLSNKRVSSNNSVAPGVFAFCKIIAQSTWGRFDQEGVSRGNETKLALKHFEYEYTGDKQFKFDSNGLAEVKATFNLIEVTPQDAIRAIRVWKQMLEREGYSLDGYASD